MVVQAWAGAVGSGDGCLGGDASSWFPMVLGLC